MKHADRTSDDALERWRAKGLHYQDEAVVREYDARRFRAWHERGSTERKWVRIRRALGRDLGTGTRVLDVPCGRGRFTSRLLESGVELVSADLSLAMLNAVAAGRGSARVRADALRLPFLDGSFDVVLSIRFLFHVPPELRVAVLSEMARVSRRYVVVDVRHKYCWTSATKRFRAWLFRRRPYRRPGLVEIDADVARAGLELQERIWLAPLFSEKMLLVCRKPAVV